MLIIIKQPNNSTVSTKIAFDNYAANAFLKAWNDFLVLNPNVEIEDLLEDMKASQLESNKERFEKLVSLLIGAVQIKELSAKTLLINLHSKPPKLGISRELLDTEEGSRSLEAL